MTFTSRTAESRLMELADPEKAAFLQRFFKTGPGEYGEGDRLLGIRVPQVRKLVREFEHLPLDEAAKLLRSKWHEARLLALLILVRQFERTNSKEKSAIYRLYLANTSYINNWDLVDLSAPQIVGGYLVDRSTAPLMKLAKSPSLWERRIAILATFNFIRRNEFEPTLAIADLLLNDPQDLIHKGVGWMLREVGNRDRAVEENFLRERCKRMPRTMLRYAIEKFPEPLRQQYLKGAVE